MTPNTTCWTVIEAAADGDRQHREIFARTYLGVVRAYLLARWRSSTLTADVDDACQCVFVECFRPGGPLARVERSASGGFRAFLFGIVRNVARRFEKDAMSPKDVPADVEFEAIASDEASLSQVFDRAWAKAVMKQAAEKQLEMAKSASPDSVRRVELLRLRFREDRPVREIAAMWKADPKEIHRQYAKARAEFRLALEVTIAFHRPGASQAEVAQECESLLALLR